MEFKRPTWSPRVSRFKIAKLYKRDSLGLQDDDLVDEVGLAFLHRIEDCLTITRALKRGEVVCPDCSTRIVRHGRAERRNHEVMSCPNCSWALPWSEYHKSIGGKHMQSAGLKSYFEEFAAGFPKAKGYRQKMILIDQVLHRYHWELEGQTGGPSAVNLIGGNRVEVLALLNRLSYGQQSTDGLSETKSEWIEKLNYEGIDRDNIDEVSEQHSEFLPGDQEADLDGG